MNELNVYKQALDLGAFVIITDHNGNITYVNDKYCQAVGYESSEIIGQNPRIFNSGYHPKAFFEEMLSTLSKGKIWNGNIRNVTKTGSHVWMETTIFPFQHDGDKKMSYLVVRHDVSQQLEDLKAREQFLTNISHEIRTPLHGIMSLVDILSETELDTEQTEFLKTIQGASQNLFSLLNDVLDFYKIGIGKMTLENTTFNIVNLINSIISLYSPKANSKKVEMFTNFDPKIPMLLQGDSNRLRQVISNLTDNALKYTNEGKIEVKTEFIEQINDLVTIRIHIKDTGIGIEKSKKGIIFNKFSQANTSDSRIYGGAGIGLHIVKELVTLMGGAVSVQSKINKGSDFSIDLSFNIPKTEIKSNNKSSKEFFIEKANILIADDSEINRMVFKKQMESMGFDYSFAENGLEALKLVSLLKFDLILLDIQMPILDGIGFLDEFNNNLKYAHVKSTPIIIVSAGNQEYLRHKYPKLTIQGYLHKPFTINDIKAKITQSINKYQTKSITDINPYSSEQNNQNIVNLTYLSELADGDIEFMEDLITKFIIQSPDCVSRIKQNYELKKYEEVKNIAHKFAPQLTFVGLDNFMSVVNSIENNAGDNSKHKMVKEQIELINLIIEKAVIELNQQIINLKN